jgi:hypothetical protein
MFPEFEGHEDFRDEAFRFEAEAIALMPDNKTFLKCGQTISPHGIADSESAL